MNILKNQKGIISLAAIFTLGLLSVAMALTVLFGASTQFAKNRNTVSGDSSFYTAEAAAREGVYQYIKNDFEGTENFSSSINNIPTSSIFFDVTSSSLGWAYREIKGDAQNNNYRMIKNRLLLDSSFAAFDYAIYSENELEIKGGGGVGSVEIKGDIFSNSTISCSGSPSMENVFSSGSIEKCEKNSNSINEGQDIIDPPQVDIEYYKNNATCTSTSSNLDSKCLNGHATGIILADAEGSKKEIVINDIDLKGNLTVLGDLRLTGGKIESSDNYLALIVEGDLTIAGNPEIYGVIYVKGTTNFSSGTPEIHGSLISVEGTKTSVSGGVKIFYQSSENQSEGLISSGGPVIQSWQEY